MKTFLRFLLALVFLAIAIACYSRGFASGAFVFVLLGIVFEAAFWLRLFPMKRRKASLKESG
jgi:hypothetical protein